MLLSFRVTIPKKSKFKKSSSYRDNVTIVLSENGFSINWSKGHAELCWDSFTNYRLFEDGSLLIRDEGAFNWLPFSAQTTSCPSEQIKEFIKNILNQNGD